MTRWMMILLMVLMGCASAGPRTHDREKSGTDRGSRLGEVLFPAPASEENAQYLGLSPQAGPFRIRQVRAGVLVVEIFDLYCIYCQRAAPEVNRFYRVVQQAGLADRVKVVGVGRRNSGVEVDAFRDRYEVEFPVFADPALSVTESLESGKMGTPHFLVLDLQDGGEAVVVDSNQGSFGDPDAFLERVRKYLKEK